MAARGETVGANMVPQLVEKHVHLPYAYPTLADTLRKSAAKVLTKYFQDNAQVFDKIEFAEKIVEVHLGDGVTVNGRIDLVRHLDTDEVYIVDLKSNDRAQPEEVTEAQLHTYARGYRELT